MEAEVVGGGEEAAGGLEQVLVSEGGVGDVRPGDSLLNGELSWLERALVLSSNLSILSLVSTQEIWSAAKRVCKFNISSEVLSICFR